MPVKSILFLLILPGLQNMGFAGGGAGAGDKIIASIFKTLAKTFVAAADI